MEASKKITESGRRSKAKVTDQNKRIMSSNSPRPTEEDIREKAKEIYLQRLDRGEDGTAENDWIEAEKYFSDLQG